jgi:branched-chain amino acid transport system permease protein
LRAATENGPLLQAFGVNVPLLVMPRPTAAAPALAALAGVLAAPVYPRHSAHGQLLVIVVFAVVVIGGMGSILGADRQRARARRSSKDSPSVIYPEASNIVVFVIMALVLILRPAGLFGRD